MTYQIGDKVSYLGITGEVAGIIQELEYPLKVSFGSEEHYFTIDGRINTRHTKPALKLLSRPKKAVKLRLFRAIYRSDKDGSFYVAPRLFESEAEAREYNSHFIKLLHTAPLQVEI